MEKYPTENDLTKLKELGKLSEGKLTSGGIRELLDFIRSIWWMPDWGFLERNGKDILEKDCLIVELHTGGWSGNETIITALQDTFFWWFFWRASHAGGHYWFEIPESFFEVKRTATEKD